MIFQLTHYCEMDCPHCADSCTPKGTHANMNTVSQVCKFASKFSAILLISGGEPTSHPNFLESFEYILYNAQDTKIILISNGSFLYDRELTSKIIELNNRFSFFVQITAVTGLYKSVSKTVELYNSIERSFKDICIIRQMTVIDQLGRAKGKNWSKFSTYVRQAPNCFNFLSCAYSPQTKTFKDVINAIQTKNQCKPFVDVSGTVHIAESTTCSHIGTIWDSDEVLYRNLINRNPCGECGVPHEELMQQLRKLYRM